MLQEGREWIGHNHKAHWIHSEGRTRLELSRDLKVRASQNYVKEKHLEGTIEDQGKTWSEIKALAIIRHDGKRFTNVLCSRRSNRNWQ